MKEIIKEFSMMDELRRVDSAFVVISSHGTGKHGVQKTEILCVDYKGQDENYHPFYDTDIIDHFTSKRCPYLKEKPKIFIFQCCRLVLEMIKPFNI